MLKESWLFQRRECTCMWNLILLINLSEYCYFKAILVPSSEVGAIRSSASCVFNTCFYDGTHTLRSKYGVQLCYASYLSVKQAYNCPLLIMNLPKPHQNYRVPMVLTDLGHLSLYHLTPANIIFIWDRCIMLS